jgi:hypothetical protein
VRWRPWALGILGFIAVILAIDWAIATKRMTRIDFEVSLDPPEVVADGQSTTVVSVRVTEQGVPRANDLLQAWLATGSGRVLPTWMYTDEDGRATIELTPNRYTPYDPQDKLELSVVDINIGRLVEVGAQETVDIPLIKPQ